MKKELLLIINALTGDEYVELKIRSTIEPTGHKMVEYNFEPSIEKITRIAYSEPVKEKVSEQELPAKVDYATYQMERAKDLLDGGDFDAAIAILQQACDAYRKNKKLAEALYDAKMAKAKVALDDNEPLQEIKLPGRTSAQPAVEEPVQDEEAAEETF